MVKMSAEANTAVRLSASKVMTTMLNGMNDTKIENEYFKIIGHLEAGVITIVVTLYKPFQKEEKAE